MTLFVLWRLPSEPMPKDAAVLSFLCPIDEEKLGHDLAVVRAREVLPSVKASVIQITREVVARAGAAVLESGQSLRQALQAQESSLWWFHPVAARNSEAHAAFDSIAAVLTIRAVANQRGISRVVLHAAPVGVADVLKQSFGVDECSTRGKRGRAVVAAYGVASRLKLAFAFLRYRWSMARYYQLPEGPFDVVLQSFWDWGIRVDATGQFNDRYFKALPSHLRAGECSFGYFAWFDPQMEPWQKGRHVRDVLRNIPGHANVVLLQRFIQWSDVLRAISDFKPVQIGAIAGADPRFSDAFLSEGFNWFPIYANELRDGFWNAMIPHLRLVALAARNAAEYYCPKLAITFLEHFPFSRALYVGLRNANSAIALWTIQHASVSREKTIFYIHPQIEAQGKPEQIAMVRPDRAYVMGELAYSVFMESGYTPAQLVLYGSPRYDYIQWPRDDRDCNRERAVEQPFNVLLACSLEVDTEIGMVEAAQIAAQEVPGIRLRLRNHPASRVDLHPRFGLAGGQIDISTALLEQDLAWADLVIFSYSTVADEALLQGLPVWQWLPNGFNGSALGETMACRQFGSVAQLRDALRAFIRNPAPERPSQAERARVARALFHPADGRAAVRIAADVITFLKHAKKSEGRATRVARGAL